MKVLPADKWIQEYFPEDEEELTPLQQRMMLTSPEHRIAARKALIIMGVRTKLLGQTFEHGQVNYLLGLMDGIAYVRKDLPRGTTPPTMGS